MSEIDLTGDWSGTYEYPETLPPVIFTATLRDMKGALSGTIEEESEGRRRAAAIEGRRVGVAVTWLKMYAERDVDHDVVYEGAVSADGAEISGHWSIFAEWSGRFLMRRRPAAQIEREREADAEE